MHSSLRFAQQPNELGSPLGAKVEWTLGIIEQLDIVKKEFFYKKFIGYVFH